MAMLTPSRKKTHIQGSRLVTKFRGAKSIHLQQNVPLDQPYMHFGTFVLYRVDFQKAVPHFMAMFTQNCKKWIFKATVYSPNSVVQETSTYSKKCSPGSTIHAFWNICSLPSWFSKNGPTFYGNAHSKLQKMHIQGSRLVTKFCGAKSIHLQQNVPLDQPYMHFGTFVLYRVDFQKTVPRFMAMLTQDQCTFKPTL